MHHSVKEKYQIGYSSQEQNINTHNIDFDHMLLF